MWAWVLLLLLVRGVIFFFFVFEGESVEVGKNETEGKIKWGGVEKVPFPLVQAG